MGQCFRHKVGYSKLREQFDYLSDEEFDVTEFFQYAGDWYCMADFLRLDDNSTFDNNKWDGYVSHTYFSGILVKYFHDGRVVVGTYSSWQCANLGSVTHFWHCRPVDLFCL